MLILLLPYGSIHIPLWDTAKAAERERKVTQRTGGLKEEVERVVSVGSTAGRRRPDEVPSLW